MRAETVIKRIRDHMNERPTIADEYPLLDAIIAELEEDLRLEKIKAGKLQSVVIKIDAGQGRVESKTVDVIPYGEFLGVHKHIRCYGVTHLPTGYRVFTGGKKDSIKFAKRLIESGVVLSESNVATASEVLSPICSKLKEEIDAGK